MIKFINHDRQFNFNQKTNLKLFLEDLFKREKRKSGDIQYIFCSDNYLLKINRQFLDHDFYTDIITFNLGGKQINAEIYISLDRVKDNAHQFGEPYRRELLRVIFHGALHLCGYKDKTKSEITLMREKENEHLAFFEKEISSRS
jgi:probable rRNA maturation factor